MKPPCFAPPAGVQGLVGPDALLCGARQERPAAHGRPGLRKPLQGQEAVHGSVSGGWRGGVEGGEGSLNFLSLIIRLSNETGVKLNKAAAPPGRPESGWRWSDLVIISAKVKPATYNQLGGIWAWLPFDLSPLSFIGDWPLEAVVVVVVFV